VCHTQGTLYVGLCQQTGDNQHDGIKVGRDVPPPPGDPWPPAVARTNYWLSAPTGMMHYLPGPALPLSPHATVMNSTFVNVYERCN